MRTIKLVVLVLMALALMIIMMANMAPVDLYLVPAKIFPGFPNLAGIPLALVIVASVLAGILMGLLMEYVRERKHRSRLDAKRREVGELREENARLSRKLGERGDDLAVLRG